MVKRQPLCLRCADLDRLVFLPAGEAAMSRRARKHSVLSAVVVRWLRESGIDAWAVPTRYEGEGAEEAESGGVRAVFEPP